MKFKIERCICKRDEEKFGGTPSLHYYDYAVIQPMEWKDICCHSMGLNTQYVNVRTEGNNTKNQKVIVLSLTKNADWGNNITLNFCPDCSTKIEFSVNDSITIEQRKKNWEVIENEKKTQ